MLEAGRLPAGRAEGAQPQRAIRSSRSRRESALRAVRTCAPFSFLPVAKYEAWKDIEINFDPQYMFRS